MRSVFPLVALSIAGLVACGGGAKVVAKSPEPPPAPVVAAPAPVADPVPDHTLRRSAVKRTVDAGLGYFLQKVVLDDEPVMMAGHFHGFRVTALQDPGFWRGVDLQPGDVILRINGMPIEHPEEALEAFRSLSVASELRVQYERDGQARELRYGILEDEPQKRPEEPQKRADASAP